MRFTLRVGTAFIILMLMLINKAYAFCPLCTIIAGVGIGLSRYLGIDDTITGIWIGAVIVSMGMWTGKMLKKQHNKFPLPTLSILLSLYLITILPLYWTNMIGLYRNTLWHIDKLILGIIVGSIIFLLGVIVDVALRATNDCKVYFYFQKVIVPTSLLIIASFIFYLITHS